jgi:osomolarity two-component system response regulator SKN7
LGRLPTGTRAFGRRRCRHQEIEQQTFEIFGCTTDVAVDGIGAVTKMNLEKYDLVLMVNLFFSSFPFPSFFSFLFVSLSFLFFPPFFATHSLGMNDILPKPFTKEGLLDML